MSLSRLLIVLSLSFAGFSCSILKLSEVHDKMAASLDSTPYLYNLTELHQKLIAHLEDDSLGGKLIVLSSNGGAAGFEGRYKVKEAMEEGFLYKDKLYSSIVDLDMALLATDFSKIKDKIFKAKHHTLEKSDVSFLVVKGNVIYEGASSKEHPGHSTLQVYELTGVVRQINYSVDWWNLLKGKGMNLSINNGPIDLVGSRKYQSRSKLEELAVFFKIDKERAELMEKELSQKI